MLRFSCCRNLSAALICFLSAIASAEPGENQFLHQQERQKALEQQLAPQAPDVNLSPPATSFSRIQFPAEKPCFLIEQVVLEGNDGMPHWLPLQHLANQARGHCLGGQGINLLMSQMQNRMIDHGYVTSRVLAPPQDLKSGTLQLHILPGKIRQVRLTDDSGHWVTLYSAFPAHNGTVAAALAGGLISDSSSGALSGAQAGQVTVENNYLSVTQALTFDKELLDCRKSAGDCQSVIDKWKQVSDKQSADTDQKLKDNPLETQVVDKELVQGGTEMTERPGWLGKLPGVDAMTSDEAKAYVQQWNGQDLANIDVSSPDWTKFAAFISDPDNQAALSSVALISKDLIQLAKSTILSPSYPVTVKSLQLGLRDPAYVDKLKKDMLNGNFDFSGSKGKIAGYVERQGRYYVTEGNHRMVAAQELYKQTGDGKYIDNLFGNGVWTKNEIFPPDAKTLRGYANV